MGSEIKMELKANIYTMPKVRLDDFVITKLDLVLNELEAEFLEKILIELNLSKSKVIDFRDVIGVINGILWRDSIEMANKKRLEPKREISRMQEVELIAKSIYFKKIEKMPHFMRAIEGV